jgi:cytidylate kinase
METERQTCRDLSVVTVDGRRGTGKTHLAVAICHTYGATLVEVGPLFRLLVWQLRRSPSLTVARATKNVLRLMASGQLVFGPLDYSSPCGLRISLRGRDLIRQLWNPKLDSLLSTISASPKSRPSIALLIRAVSTSRPLVAVGREAGTEFFQNAGLKFLLTSQNDVREARKRKQLSRINGNTTDPVDTSEPALAIRAHHDSIEIDTTDLPPGEVFAQAQSFIDRKLGWKRMGAAGNDERVNTLSDAQEAVLQFYKRFELPIPSSPELLNVGRVSNLASWIKEEATELAKARSIESQADAFADILYFAIGGFVELGVDAGTVFRLVHEANMNRKTTQGEVIRHPTSGKILKPPAWKSPIGDIRQLLASLPDRKS